MSSSTSKLFLRESNHTPCTNLCSNSCCEIITLSYDERCTPLNFSHKFNKEKGGMFIYDSSSQRILLVQSRGLKWGPPKGTKEATDSCIADCAMREVQEETGIAISADQLKNCQTFVIDKTTYYIVDISNVPIITSGSNNEISGYTWIHINCIHSLRNLGRISMHGRILIHNIFGVKA
jgi:hypothetical protein